MTSERTSFQFGDFELIPDRQALLHRGEAVNLGGRAFDILTLLVRRAGETVSRAELFEQVWPGYLVHDHNLKVNVGNLRRILAACDPVAQYVATIAGRGYKFVAVLNAVEEAPSKPSPGSGGLRLAPPPNAAHLYGRDEALHQIAVRVQQNGYVTIVGPGGAGKTSIAVTAALQFRAVGQPVAFVDLSTLSSSQFVIPAMAAALGISLSLDDPISGVIALLRTESPILIIDNCEHVIATTAALLERISQDVPEAQIIATSREPLRTRHEHVFHLAKLDFPRPGAVIKAEEALQYPAVRLFLAKAGRGDDTDLDSAYVQAVASICARLDGLALAIELAAGTAGSFGAEALTELFREGFGAMHRGRRDAPLRHQTLEAALDWSYRLLPEQEAVLFKLLSVFAGRFSAEDAESIFDAGHLDPMTGRDALGQLVAKSLVSADVIAGVLRYRLVESTWLYASQRLLSSPDIERAKTRFAARVLARMQEAERDWSILTSREWLQRYGDQMDDLRSAIGWAFGPCGDKQIGVELVVAALPMWQEFSAFKEMLQAIEQARHAEAARHLTSVSLTKMLIAQAWAMTLAHQMHRQTNEVWQESIAQAALTGDPDFQFRAAFGQSISLAYSGRPRTALRSLKSYMAASHLDLNTAPDGMRRLAHVEIYAGCLEQAALRLELLAQRSAHPSEGKGLSRFQVDLPVAIGYSHSFLSWLQGQSERASYLARLAIDRATELDHMISLGNAISHAGLPVSFLTGDLATASRLQAQLAEVAKRENVGIYEGASKFFEGAICKARGDNSGLLVMEQGIAELTENRWHTRVAFYRALLAADWVEAGELERAESCLSQVLLSPDVREERWCHPELWRVAGLIAAKMGRPDKGMRYFERSMRAAQAMGATVFKQRTRITARACFGD